MIQFPETAQTEWSIVADAAHAETLLKQRIEHDNLVAQEVEKLRRRHDANQIFQQELDADSTPVLEMMTLDNFQNAAGPTALIEGVLNDNSLCIMLGPSGSGKSTTALQMIHSLLSGTDWLGQPTKPLSGGAGIMSYDMDAGMIMDWMRGFPNVDQRKISVVNAHKRGNPLAVPQMREQIVNAWKALNVEVVLIDSFSASFFGKDQNDAAVTMAYYRDMLKFALTEVGARALIVIVHSTEGSPNKARGSTVHHDVADSIVAQEGTGSEPRKIRMVKYRAAMGTHQMNPVIVTAPDDVTHLVDLDTGAMTMEGMALPPSVIAQAFTAIPDPVQEPETDSEDDEGSDDL